MSFPRAIDSGPGSADAIPASPPPEVIEAMHLAAQAHERLTASGRTLRFSHHRDTGRLNVQLVDGVGNVLRKVPPTAVLHVAAGGGLA